MCIVCILCLLYSEFCFFIFYLDTIFPTQNTTKITTTKGKCPCLFNFSNSIFVFCLCVKSIIYWTQKEYKWISAGTMMEWEITMSLWKKKRINLIIIDFFCNLHYNKCNIFQLIFFSICKYFLYNTRSIY